MADTGTVTINNAPILIADDDIKQVVQDDMGDDDSTNDVIRTEIANGDLSGVKTADKAHAQAYYGMATLTTGYSARTATVAGQQIKLGDKEDNAVERRFYETQFTGDSFNGADGSEVARKIQADMDGRVASGAGYSFDVDGDGKAEYFNIQVTKDKNGNVTGYKLKPTDSPASDSTSARNETSQDMAGHRADARTNLARLQNAVATNPYTVGPDTKGQLQITEGAGAQLTQVVHADANGNMVFSSSDPETQRANLERVAYQLAINHGVSPEGAEVYARDSLKNCGTNYTQGLRDALADNSFGQTPEKTAGADKTQVAPDAPADNSKNPYAPYMSADAYIISHLTGSDGKTPLPGVTADEVARIPEYTKARFGSGTSDADLWEVARGTPDGKMSARQYADYVLKMDEMLTPDDGLDLGTKGDKSTFGESAAGKARAQEAVNAINDQLTKIDARQATLRGEQTALEDQIKKSQEALSNGTASDPVAEQQHILGLGEQLAAKKAEIAEGEKARATMMREGREMIQYRAEDLKEATGFEADAGEIARSNAKALVDNVGARAHIIKTAKDVNAVTEWGSKLGQMTSNIVQTTEAVTGRKDKFRSERADKVQEARMAREKNHLDQKASLFQGWQKLVEMGLQAKQARIQDQNSFAARSAAAMEQATGRIFGKKADDTAARQQELAQKAQSEQTIARYNKSKAV